MRLFKLLVTTLLLISFGQLSLAQQRDDTQRWSVEQANDWYKDQPWFTGFNYAPSYAINQIEMWQEDTFDPDVIERELAWAEEIGFTMARVFLHNLLWEQDQQGFLKRIETFLEIAAKHNIKIMMILFDDVWDPAPHLGKQRNPIPHTHNSGWVQAPGKEILEDVNRHDELEGYVRGIFNHFRDDKRIAVWDIYNEPGNLNENTYGSREVANKQFHTLQLLKKIFYWARTEKPTQPLTLGVWRSHNGAWDGENPTDPAANLYNFMLKNSDIITFHTYEGLKNVKGVVRPLQDLGRPIICTEYMARPYSTFEEIMPYLAEHKIGAINWGFIAGRSQTNYPWESWDKAYNEEAKPWFHDILRVDGSPYRDEEVKFINDLINRTK